MSAPYRKKLIEVALPLAEINKASAREKSIRHGHPSTLHLWWARRPLAACRAVLFASLVDDPSAVPDEFPTEAEQVRERERLFAIIKQLVLWENSTNQTVLDAAKQEIARSAARDKGLPAPTAPQAVQQFLTEHAPPVLDPFCGGGSIPLEAQRLGLRAEGRDLNPVAVLLTKALIELPPRFVGQPPVNPQDRAKMGSGIAWPGASGLAADVRSYGRWLRDEAQRRLGHLYPTVPLPGGGEATVIAWLWARTVRCPNPACGAPMPLVRSFALSTKKAKEAWVEPQVDQAAKTVRFTVRTGQQTKTEREATALGSGFINERGKKVKATFQCIVCRAGIAKGDYIDREADAGRMGVMPVAIVAEGAGGRTYLPFDKEQGRIALEDAPRIARSEAVRAKIPTEPARGTFASNAQGRIYGFKTFGDYFTPRQLVALTTFSDLVTEARARVLADALAAGLASDGCGVAQGGRGARAYADAVATYLALAVDKGADYWSSICSWHSSRDTIRNTFARQAIPMIWDFAEVNPFSDSTGNFQGAVAWVAGALAAVPAAAAGQAAQRDAAASVNGLPHPLISTDPPYYDNIGYADLADFFYVWLRRALRDLYPELFATLLVPKTEELVATPYRFAGSKERAQQFFEEGLGQAFAQMRAAHHPDYPLTIYYAFKQAETEGEEDGNGETVGRVASTGWETMLEGLLQAGFQISGTWPVRTELLNRPNDLGANALASSIVLVCRPRPAAAPAGTRREFLTALQRELPEALRTLQQGNIAPVDLQQAAIGPGMAIFSRYRQVVDPGGTPLPVRAALTLINQALDAVLSAQEGDFDGDTRWAITWFEQHGLNEGDYGSAETLSKAKDTSVARLQSAGLLQARAGTVRLRRREELPEGGFPHSENPRLSVWMVTQQLIKALHDGGEKQAAALLTRVGAPGETARELAYRLYVTCERKGWQEEAGAYNGLVTSWPAIAQARAQGTAPRQETLA